MVSFIAIVLVIFILLVSMQELVNDNTNKVLKDYCNIECKSMLKERG